MQRKNTFISNKFYSKLLKEWHHQRSDGAALANFSLFQEFFIKRLGINNLLYNT
jgi:hypothetical protein